MSPDLTVISFPAKTKQIKALQSEAFLKPVLKENGAELTRIQAH